jgi:hypothetical protein
MNEQFDEAYKRERRSNLREMALQLVFWNKQRRTPELVLNLPKT